MSEPTPDPVRARRRVGRSTPRGLRARALALVLALAWIPGSRAAAGTCTTLEARAPVLAGSVGITGGEGLPLGVLERAVGEWSRCANYGTGFPAFAVGSRGDQTLTVRYLAREIGRGRCGSFAGREILLYPRILLADGRVERCGALHLNLAHELGHALGLRDAAEDRACREHVMAGIRLSSVFARGVTEQECQVVGQRWLTPAEMSAVTASRRADLTGLVTAGGK